MNQALKKLIPAIASYVKDRESNLSKTKLLKLLYLFDVEFYRLRHETFSGFQWKFYHLGPWTNELDPLLEELVNSGEMIQRPYSQAEYEGNNYEAAEDVDINSLFKSDREAGILKRILSIWAERPLGDILDHVYFHTEPMENGIRNTLLDFGTISTQSQELYRRASSETSPKQAARVRQAIKDKLAALKHQQTERFEFTPPRYDEEFFKALSKLDETPA